MQRSKKKLPVQNGRHPRFISHAKIYSFRWNSFFYIHFFVLFIRSFVTADDASAFFTILMLLLIISSICSNWAPRLMCSYFSIFYNFILCDHWLCKSELLPFRASLILFVSLRFFFVCSLSVLISVICKCFVAYKIRIIIFKLAKREKRYGYKNEENQIM